jgi:signal transduction histidine kinase
VKKFCRVHVSNSGPAIDAENLSRMFQRFHEADDARSGEGSGYGLGLSICQKIVEVHGGLIRAESIEGEGTTIHVHLPRRA